MATSLHRRVFSAFAHRATVTGVDHLHTRAARTGVVRLTLAGPGLVADTPCAGQKVQVHVGRGASRTYTLAAHNPQAGTGALVVQTHTPAKAPGATWAADVAVGDEVLLLGPAKAAQMPTGDVAWLAVLGDVTALGLTEAIFAQAAPGARLQAVIEAPFALNGALVHRGAGAIRTVTPGAAPGGAALTAFAALDVPPTGTLWFAGHRALVRTLKRAAAARGVPAAHVHTAPHWR